ncbi:MAG: zf-HC2 domain-containing protein [Anaerolineales bacterium]|nr:zf-HC2 domain-containing protein [Anaerolineales bacterium]
MKALTHAQAQEWLQLAADGLLPAEQQAQLAAHLQSCPQCQAYADELNSLEGLLTHSLESRWGNPGLPPAASRSLLEQLGSQPARATSTPWLILLALAVAALLAWLLFGQTPAVPGAPTPSPSVAASSAAATATASRTPATTATAPTAPLTLFAVPLQTANCREGNSSQFDIADTLYQNERYQPIGRGTDNLWLQFRGPVTQTLCWAFVGNMTVLLNDETVALEDVPESVLPYIAYPPAPTATATLTPQPSPTAVPQCSDGLDNDGDGYTDMTDRECSDPSDDNEAN